MSKSINKVMGWLLLLPLLAGCNDTDDVTRIFTGRTWKLTYITVDGGHEMFGFWETPEQEMKSLEELGKSGTYSIVFEGTVEEERISGRVKGTVVTSYALDGTWSANGKSNEFRASVTGNDGGDRLAKAFIEGLNNATKYEGDDKNLYLLYTPKGNANQRFRMAFRAVNN